MADRRTHILMITKHEDYASIVLHGKKQEIVISVQYNGIACMILRGNTYRVVYMYLMYCNRC